MNTSRGLSVFMSGSGSEQVSCVVLLSLHQNQNQGVVGRLSHSWWHISEASGELLLGAVEVSMRRGLKQRYTT